MNGNLCSKCGSLCVRIRRKTLQKLLYRGSKRYRCFSCDSVYLVNKSGERISK